MFTSFSKSKFLSFLTLFLVVLFVGVVIVAFFVPALTWTIRAINGGIQAEPLNLTTENVITYAISMLTLLVTIITLGVGFIAIVGYKQIKDSAIETAKTVASDEAKRYFERDSEEDFIKEKIQINDNDEKLKEDIDRVEKTKVHDRDFIREKKDDSE